MKNSHEESPLYRFFNVILFILYICVILISVGVGLSAYWTRTVIGASVQCEDQTRWDATKIHSDNYALCGICTKRSSDNNNYNSCTYDDMSYSSFDLVDKKYAWSWWVILAPVIVFSVGFALVDFLKIVVIYIFYGRIAFEKSLLLLLLRAMSDFDNKQ